MSTDPRVGVYLVGREPLVVSEGAEGLRAALLGVPDDFAARLIDDGGRLLLEGGEFAGATIEFDEGDPSPGGRFGGTIAFTRAPDGLALPGGRGLRLPPFEPPAEEERAYGLLLERITGDADGRELVWELPWPKWRFVEWLSRQGSVVFHGSNRPDIDEFRPVRTSVELMDHGGGGNLAAVYGTKKGLWAMWFAVIDRGRVQGSIQNGVATWRGPGGEGVDFYHFSVDRSVLGPDLWRPGTLYLLRADGFVRNRYYPDGPHSHEWASPSAVRPLKRLRLEPAEFPFLDAVGTHDDSELIRADALGDIVTSKIRRARLVAGGLVLDLEWDDELAGVIDEYLATRRKYFPDVRRTLTEPADGGGATLEVLGPPGYIQAYRHSLEEADVPLEEG